MISMRFIWLIAFFLICQIFLVIYAFIQSKAMKFNGDTDEWPTWNKTNITSYLETSTSVFTSSSVPGIPDICSLATYSSWDPVVMKYTDVYYDRKNDVCVTPDEWAYLEQQVLKSRSEYRCKGRCFYDRLWEEEGAKFDCEFIETECVTIRNVSSEGSRKSYLSQIIEKPPSPPIPSPKRHNIYVIMIDTISVHQSRRNFPKSLYFMHRELEAVEYDYVNKVGENSYPNGISLFYGKTVEDIDKRLLGLNTTFGNWEQICSDPEKAVHIMTEAEKVGYKTLTAEDWYFGVLDENTCPCHTYTRQFKPHHQSPMMHSEKTRGTIELNSSCTTFRKSRTELLSYYSQFTKSYKDSPKFAWLWLTVGSHGIEPEAMSEDTEIYDFFIRNKEELGNSFVFFMGDHGLRSGQKLYTSLGEYDSRNPFLAISIPKQLRGGRLMENLRKNSRQLQSHYDTRATMLDIMNYQPAVNYTAWKMEQFGEEKGNSYLREQPGPRTCHTLPIPFQYCLCEYKMQQIDSNSEMGKTLANSTLALINQKIIESHHTSRCGLWQLKEAEIEGFDPIDKTGAFQIFLKIRQDGWENGALRTTVRYNDQNKLELISAIRSDTTFSTDDCAAKDVRAFCFCFNKRKF